MNLEENFSVTLARQVLENAGEEIQLAVLDEMVTEESVVSLEEQIQQAKGQSKKAGDFGMEILGSVLVPVLIEAGKALWKAYVKKLEEKAAGKLADLTVAQAKNLANSLWKKSDSPITLSEYEVVLRSAATKNGLTTEEIERLVAAIRTNH